MAATDGLSDDYLEKFTTGSWKEPTLSLAGFQKNLKSLSYSELETAFLA
jgi:hypothetical protein